LIVIILKFFSCCTLPSEKKRKEKTPMAVHCHVAKKWQQPRMILIFYFEPGMQPWLIVIVSLFFQATHCQKIKDKIPALPHHKRQWQPRMI